LSLIPWSAATAETKRPVPAQFGHEQGDPNSASVSGYFPAFPLTLPANDSPVSADTAPVEHGNQHKEIEGFFNGIKWTDAIIAFFTVILAIYTARLFYATRGLWIAAKDQVIDTKDSVAAAKKSANVAEESLTSLERAFVFPENFSLTGPLGSPGFYCIATVWKNAGRSWTKRCINHINWRAFESPLLEDFNFPDFGDPQTRVHLLIGPGATVNGQRIDIPHSVFAETMEGRRHLYIWGWCEYDDIFLSTPRHRTEFCVKLEKIIALDEAEGGRQKAAVQFSYHNKHNGADDDCLKALQT
jgi:hypothetical protein